jgi:hypothetical protein
MAGAALALLLALPAAARQRTAVFQVGAVVAPSARVYAAPGPRSLRLSIASNAPPPAVQVGNGTLQPPGATDLRLPRSGTVVVTLHY